MGEITEAPEQFYAEGESPLEIIEEIIENSAVTDGDKKLAADAKIKLREFINYWKDRMRGTKEIYDRPNATEPMPPMSQIVKDSVGGVRIWINATQKQPERIYPGTELITETEEGEIIVPSEEFINRVLRRLGTIEEEQTHDALKQYPKQTPIGTMNPVFWYDEYRPDRPAYAHHIPLKIPGATMFLRADFPKKDSYPHELSIYVDVPTLEKLLQNAETQ